MWNDALALITSTPKGETWPSIAELQKVCITQAKTTDERQWLSAVSNKIRKGTRKLAKAVNGSQRRERLRVAVARTEAKQRHIRRDFNQKLATGLVRENSVVVLEALNVSGMVTNRRLAKAMSWVGWRQIRTMGEAKSTMIADRDVRVISRWDPTSRSVLCLNCGAEHDRDENASNPILVTILVTRGCRPNERVSQCQTSLEAVGDDPLTHQEGA